MRFPAKKSGKLPLGLTSRSGTRTGHIEVPWEVSEAIAESFVSQFDDNCTDNRLKPPPEWKVKKDPLLGGQAVIKDAAYGQPVVVSVVLAPATDAFSDTSLPAVGKFNSRTNEITISPTFGACRSRESWKNVLQSVIRHELTHAMDPSIYLDSKRLYRWAHQAKSWQTGHRKDFPSLKELPRHLRPKAEDMYARMVGKQTKEAPPFCDYVNSKRELKAFMTQIATEITVVGKRISAQKEKGFKNPEDAIKASSPTYREIEKCFTPKIKNKFLKMAARLWDNGVIPKR